jgi:hypothetical protein
VTLVPWSGWRDATRRALYGSDGFYVRERPAAHFRTSVHASASYAAALLRLARATAAGEIVDVGAGGGELLATLGVLDPGMRLHGVDLAPRPAGLPAEIGWSDAAPGPAPGTVRLIVANEWLDNIPVDIAETDDRGVPRLVLVDPADGSERLGDPVAGEDAAWLERWWPLAGREAGARAEIGHPRDAAWATAVRSVGRGLAVAADYAHVAQARPALGTLAAYCGGRAVIPVPDGSCDLTAHVALDACAAAGERAGATATLLTTQRAALDALGLDPTRPPLELAIDDPPGYLGALAAALEVTELRDPDGLGAFGWLVQAVGVDLPGVLTGDHG